jgi:hypothetical protein
MFFKTVMQRDAREAVVRDALKYYQQASPAVQQQLENAIQAARVKINGFREPLGAPLSVLLPKVATTASRSHG